MEANLMKNLMEKGRKWLVGYGIGFTMFITSWFFQWPTQLIVMSIGILLACISVWRYLEAQKEKSEEFKKLLAREEFKTRDA